jgi:hypothetical protein
MIPYGLVNADLADLFPEAGVPGECGAPTRVREGRASAGPASAAAPSGAGTDRLRGRFEYHAPLPEVDLPSTPTRAEDRAVAKALTGAQKRRQKKQATQEIEQRRQETERNQLQLEILVQEKRAREEAERARYIADLEAQRSLAKREREAAEERLAAQYQEEQAKGMTPEAIQARFEERSIGPRPNFLDHQEGVINGRQSYDRQGHAGDEPLRSSRRTGAIHPMLLLKAAAARVENA